MLDDLFGDPEVLQDEQKEVLDWANLPSGVRVVSLWDSLHDEKLFR
jgi:hypothetical protein